MLGNFEIKILNDVETAMEEKFTPVMEWRKKGAARLKVRPPLI